MGWDGESREGGNAYTVTNAVPGLSDTSLPLGPPECQLVPDSAVRG